MYTTRSSSKRKVSEIGIYVDFTPAKDVSWLTAMKSAGTLNISITRNQYTQLKTVIAMNNGKGGVAKATRPTIEERKLNQTNKHCIYPAPTHVTAIKVVRLTS